MSRENSIRQERDRRRAERELYQSSYMTGSDAVIRFGSEILVQVNSINFAITESVQPIYGAWSYTYDKIALGVRHIQGVFTINFISPNYIIEHLYARANTGAASSDGADNVSTVQPLDLTTPEARESFMQHLTQLLNDGNFEQVERLAADQARLIHGSQQQVDPTEASVFHNKHGLPGPSQLTIEYFSQRGTMRKVIEGVAIVSCAQLVDMSGRTVMEEYQFIGKDMRFEN